MAVQIIKISLTLIQTNHQHMKKFTAAGILVLLLAGTLIAQDGGKKKCNNKDCKDCSKKECKKICKKDCCKKSGTTAMYK